MAYCTCLWVSCILLKKTLMMMYKTTEFPDKILYQSRSSPYKADITIPIFSDNYVNLFVLGNSHEYFFKNNFFLFLDSFVYLPSPIRIVWQCWQINAVLDFCVMRWFMGGVHRYYVVHQFWISEEGRIDCDNENNCARCCTPVWWPLKTALCFSECVHGEFS